MVTSCDANLCKAFVSCGSRDSQRLRHESEYGSTAGALHRMLRKLGVFSSFLLLYHHYAHRDKRVELIDLAVRRQIFSVSRMVKLLPKDETLGLGVDSQTLYTHGPHSKPSASEAVFGGISRGSVAEIDHASNPNDVHFQQDVSGVCRDLKELQHYQVRLGEQMDNLMHTFRTVLVVQSRVNEQIAALAERSFVQRYTKTSNVPAEPPSEVTTAGLHLVPAGPYPQFDAGLRLTSISELLEMILLELPSDDILFAQRTNRQFRDVIAQSHPLQQRLFFAPLSIEADPGVIPLNPIITNKRTLPHVPLYFDRGNMTTAYCHGGKVWIDLELTDCHVSATSTLFSDQLYQDPLGAGSWKQMCLSQPPCEVKWHLDVREESERAFRHRYSRYIFQRIHDGHLSRSFRSLGNSG